MLEEKDKRMTIPLRTPLLFSLFAIYFTNATYAQTAEETVAYILYGAEEKFSTSFGIRPFAYSKELVTIPMKKINDKSAVYSGELTKIEKADGKEYKHQYATNLTIRKEDDCRYAASMYHVVRVLDGDKRLIDIIHRSQCHINFRNIERPSLVTSTRGPEKYIRFGKSNINGNITCSFYIDFEEPNRPRHTDFAGTAEDCFNNVGVEGRIEKALEYLGEAFCKKSAF